MSGLQLARTGSVAEAGIHGLTDFRESTERDRAARQSTFKEDLMLEDVISRRASVQAQLENARNRGGMTENQLVVQAQKLLESDIAYMTAVMDDPIKAQRILRAKIAELRATFAPGGLGIGGLGGSISNAAVTASGGLTQ